MWNVSFVCERNRNFDREDKQILFPDKSGDGISAIAAIIGPTRKRDVDVIRRA